MKTVDIGPDSPTMAELLGMADQEHLILRTGDGREYFLAEVDDLDEEVALIRGNAELMAFLDDRSKETQTCSASEVRQILASQGTAA